VQRCFANTDEHNDEFGFGFVSLSFDSVWIGSFSHVLLDSHLSEGFCVEVEPATMMTVELDS
jgi:hypothetical protein